jgi:hypothetical protein
MMATQMTIHDLGKPLASGRTAEVYDWKPGWVLKLFFAWREPEIADFERRIATAISTAGITAPSVGEIVRVNGRVGLLYENCEGQSMNADLQEHFFHGPLTLEKWPNFMLKCIPNPCKPTSL